MKQLPPMEEFSFSKWFAVHEKNAIEGIALEVPNEIIRYILDEKIILPKECYPPEEDDTTHTFSCLDNIENDEEADDSAKEETPEFPEFSKQITEIIERLNGNAFMKTNWHAPKDAYWITAGQTLKIRDISDVYQLLKASSIVKSDFSKPPDSTISFKYLLVFKEWNDIHPGTEFRCFVRNHNLIAITPRDWPQFHLHITQQAEDIVSDIVTLFKETIKNKFPLSNYAFDVIRVSKDNVKLIDFSPFNKLYTDGLAFEWNYLYGDNFSTDKLEDDDPEFRYLTSDCGIQPSSRNNYGVPQDIIDMFNSGEAITSTNFTDLLAERARFELELN